MNSILEKKPLKGGNGGKSEPEEVKQADRRKGGGNDTSG